MTSKDESSPSEPDECPECGGTLIEQDEERFCRNCAVVASDTVRVESLDPYEYHRMNPSYHSNSGRRRCFGGFPHTYDWVSSGEIDETVDALTPTDFYK